jgi:hypothetical protein
MAVDEEQRLLLEQALQQQAAMHATSTQVRACGGWLCAQRGHAVCCPASLLTSSLAPPPRPLQRPQLGAFSGQLGSPGAPFGGGGSGGGLFLSRGAASKEERARAAAEARQAKEIAKAMAAQEKEARRREAQAERERRVEEKKKAADDKRR